jgi:hypothetical protein
LGALESPSMACIKMPTTTSDKRDRLIKVIICLLTLNVMLLLWTVEFLMQEDHDLISPTYASPSRRFQGEEIFYDFSRSLGSAGRDIAHDRHEESLNEQRMKTSPDEPTKDESSPQQHRQPLMHIKLPREVRSYHPNGNNSSRMHHNPEQRRNCLSLTATPKEMTGLKRVVRLLLNYKPYDMFDAIHLCIPDNYMRFQQENTTRTSRTPPSTEELLSTFVDPRIIIHRLADYGPMTRYIGPLSFEKHPETTITIFDVDSTDMVALLTKSSRLKKKKPRDLTHLVYAARLVDTDAVWCHQGEDFLVNQYDQVKEVWDSYPLEITSSTTTGKNSTSWCRVDFCRATGGLLFKPKHFENFWWNQTAYHESCFWDDDRWVSYQMERQKFPLKAIHEPDQEDLATWRRRNIEEEEIENAERLYHGRRLGSLTKVTNKMKSHETCPLAWLKQHPEAYPLSRVITEGPWILEKKKGKKKTAKA